MAVPAPQVHVGSVVEQQPDDLDAPSAGRDHQRRLSVSDETDIRATSNQESRNLDLAPEGRLEPIQDTRFVWPELRFAARDEHVLHLDDLMLRRTRLGLLLPGGGEAILPRVQMTVQHDLGWDDARWAAQVERYLKLWNDAYSPRLLSRDAP